MIIILMTGKATFWFVWIPPTRRLCYIHSLPHPTQGLCRIPWQESEWDVIFTILATTLTNIILVSNSIHSIRNIIHQHHQSISSHTCAEVMVAVRLVALTDQATWVVLFHVYICKRGRCKKNTFGVVCLFQERQVWTRQKWPEELRRYAPTKV